MDEILNDFLTETAENLAVLDVELVRLEQNPGDPTLLGNIFRLVHTIKGTCGFLGLPRLERIAHAAEDVLSRLRAGEISGSAEIISLILTSLDKIRAILAVLEATEAEPAGDDAAFIVQLQAAAEGALASETAPQTSLPETVDAPPSDADGVPGYGAAERAELLHFVATLDAMVGEARFDPDRDLAAEAGSEPPEAAPQETVALRLVPSAAPASEHQPPAAAATPESGIAAQTIRVSVDLLENLMTMVSELVLTRNQLLQIARSRKDSDFSGPLQSLSLVTSELQEGVMKTRMQPIGNAWAKVPRLVRDLGIELGKKIELRMIGAETELDRQVLELIKDPLTHMVRNSADHGLEKPQERLAAGKPETGTVRLEAYHEGGHIIIEIADDGRGLDIDRIKEKAVKSGLATESQIDQMTDQQIQQFIFRAGFSTAAAVTAVSGRGVGMDVVRTNIEKIGGTIELRSRQGSGSCFIIKIPLTLAIVSALVVESAGERFAIPQVSVLELVRASGASEHRIERIQGTPVLRLRDKLLPLVSLRSLLHLAAETEEDGGVGESFVVVLQVGASTFGIMVDRVFDTEEIVVKPAAPLLRHISLFSGNTILGDGSVIMILDPNGVLASLGEAAPQEEAANAAGQGASNDKESLLLFRAGPGAPKAVPLALVSRLERFPAAAIETSDGRLVVQYRGGLMPLVPAEYGVEPARTGTQPVLVFDHGRRPIGLLVEEIIDIVEAHAVPELEGSRPEIMGSTVLAGRATELVDVHPLLQQAGFPAYSRQPEISFARAAE